MSVLTPTQKAKLTKTFYIRVKVWTPTGATLEYDLPWVSQEEGDALLTQVNGIASRKMRRTNVQWEEIALEALNKHVKEKVEKVRPR